MHISRKASSWTENGGLVCGQARMNANEAANCGISPRKVFVKSVYEISPACCRDVREQPSSQTTTDTHS